LQVVFEIAVLFYFCNQNQKIYTIMDEESQFVLDQAAEGMEAAIEHLEHEFHKIRAGKASPDMLEDVKFDYYGTMTPLNQAANINTPDSRLIVVQPFDKNMLPIMEKAIQAANLGLNPQNNGEVLRIQVPPITEQRRRDLVKQAKNEAENAKVSIRNIRRSANDDAKQLKKDGLPEDDVKKLEDDIQKLTDNYVKKVDDRIEDKEKDLMAV
jgi:ribosome recycling factor